MNPEFECRGMAVPSFMTRTLYQPPTSLIEDTCKYTDIWLCTFDISLVILLKLICFTSQGLMSIFTFIVAYAYAVCLTISVIRLPISMPGTT